MASYLLIANPMAGRGVGATRAEALRSLLARDHHVELATTSGRGNATELACARGSGFDAVIAIGGDGTLNEVLRGVMDLGGSADARPALGYLPGGTANVATVAFDFPTRPDRLARALRDVGGRRVDVGIVEVGGDVRPFLLWCSAGLDAVVIDELNSSRTGHMGIAGLAANVPRVLSAVARYPVPNVHVTADGSDLPPAASVVLANVRQIAFGGTLHPRASPFDGQLDVVTIADASPLGVLAAGARLLTSALTASRGVAHRTATSVALRGDGDVPVQVDGEPIGHLPAAVHLEEAAIRLLVGEGVSAP